MRRLMVLLSGLIAWCLLMAGAFVPAAMAQEATPGVDLSAYPVVDVTITDSAYQVKNNQIPAGYILLKVTNQTKEQTGAGIIGPAAGQTMDQMQQAAATPAPNNGFPPFLYTATIAGGPSDIAPGKTGQQIVHVPAGDWVIFGEGNQPPAPITATKTADSVSRAPTGDVVVTETNFLFTGLTDSVQAGNQLWEVTNTSDQPHMLVLAKVPDGTTVDQVLAVAALPENATPPAGGLQQSDFNFIGDDVLLQSQNQTVWVPLNLTAGTYVALCFVTDPATGMPHAMEGMISVFQVGGGATPEATPVS